MKDKGGKQHCLTFCWLKPGVWDIFEKEGTSEKGCVEIEDWETFVHFVLAFLEHSMQSLSVKRILKALLHSSDLPSCLAMAQIPEKDTH